MTTIRKSYKEVEVVTEIIAELFSASDNTSREEILKKLGNVNAVDHLGETAMHKAAWANDAECAKLLLDHNADVNIKNKNGQTPLMIAERNRNSKVADLIDNVKKEMLRHFRM